MHSSVSATKLKQSIDKSIDLAFTEKKLSIVSKNLGRKLEFVFGKAPYLGIWAKPAAPYVCIEPWYGVNDSHEDYGEVSNKVGIQSLEAGESFEFSWTAEVIAL